MQDANAGRMTFAYDAAGRKRVSVDQVGARTTTTYDAAGRLRRQVDARGWVTTHVYDAAGRRDRSLFPDGTRTTWTWHAGGSPLVIADATGRYTRTFDAARLVRDVAFPTGHVLTILRDALSRRSVLLDPDAGRTTYTYDAAGRIARLTDPLGNRTIFADTSVLRLPQPRIGTRVRCGPGARGVASMSGADRNG